jgi:glycosyltransferase involved in cell wall biosynthesis
MTIKVFHIITKLELGGAQGNTLYTCAHLDRAGFSAELVCGPGGILDTQAKSGAYPAHFVPELVREINPLKDIAACIKLYRLLKKHKPHIVHTHSSKAGILGRLAAKLAGVPVIIHTFHGFGFTPGQKPPVRAVFVFAEKFCARFSTALIFVSKANMDEARKRGFCDKGNWRLIRSGIKLSDYPPEKPDRAGTLASLALPPDARYVLCIGNFKPQKNPLDFVRVAAEVAKKMPDIFFVCTGDGELKNAARDLALKNGIAGRCRFPGWRGDAPQLLACAEAFTLTSLWEGLPRAVVEALKSGAPCALYATDGVRDIIRDGENGFIVPPGNAAALAEKISALLGDAALRARMADAARTTDLKEFDIDEMVKSQERLYLELCKK